MRRATSIGRAVEKGVHGVSGRWTTALTATVGDITPVGPTTGSAPANVAFCDQLAATGTSGPLRVTRRPEARHHGQLNRRRLGPGHLGPGRSGTTGTDRHRPGHGRHHGDLVTGRPGAGPR